MPLSKINTNSIANTAQPVLANLATTGDIGVGAASAGGWGRQMLVSANTNSAPSDAGIRFDGSYRSYGIGGGGQNSGAFRIYDFNAGVNRMLIDTNGYMTKPYQPMFRAQMYSSGANPYYSFYSMGSVGMSAGTYGGNPAVLAPVTGTYYISFNSIVASSLTTRVDIYIRYNGGNLVATLSEENGSGYHYRSASIMTLLNAGDAIQINAGGTAYNNSTGGTGSEWSNFSMALIN